MKYNGANSIKQQGFSLVELMTALLIGLILMAGLSTMFVTTKRNYTAQDSMARLQENGRIAMQILTREIRAAGYYGCANDVDSVTNTLNGAASGYGPYSHAVPIQGGDNGSGLYPGPVALPAGVVTDSISLRYADNEDSFEINAQMPQTSAALNITTGSATGVNVGDILFISDCTSAAIFQITGPGSAGDSLSSAGTVVHNTGAFTPGPGNASKNLGKQFDIDAKVMKYVQATYYIKPGASGQPALWRSVLGTEVELIEGIEAMEILYGVDSDADGTPDQYMQAGSANLQTEAQWRNVKSVRVGLVARALANKTVSDDKGQTRTVGEADVTPPALKQIDIDGDGNTDLDTSTLLPVSERLYQRRVFRTTLLLRNM